MVTTTPRLGLSKPLVDGDDDQWGTYWNGNADVLDAEMALQGDLAAHLADHGNPHAVTAAQTGALSQAAADMRYLPLAGGTLTGPLLLAGDPTTALAAATKQYADSLVGTKITDAPSDGGAYGRLNAAWTQVLPLTGGTLTGPLLLAGDPAVALGAATKQYVDAGLTTKLGDAPSDGAFYARRNAAWAVAPTGLADSPSDGSAYGRLSAAWAKVVPIAGGTLTGPLLLAADPAVPAGAATKAYVDAQIAAGGTFVDAPADGNLYGRINGIWAFAATPASVPGASKTAPLMDGTAAAGSGATWSRGDHVHPSDTSRYAASNPSGYQTAAQVTASLAPYAPLASPGFTGTPTAPTPTAGDSSTRVATTAFVSAYAPLISPTFTGDPKAPTAAAGDNDTSVATTAFVQAAVAPAFNDVGRNKLHNSQFIIGQRGAGPWTSTGYTIDRWASFMNASVDAASISQIALTDADRAGIGDETAINALQTVFTGGTDTNAYIFLAQRIERVRRLSGKTVTISFWAKASAAGMKMGVNGQQQFGTGGSPSATGYWNGLGVSVTLATTWARYSVPFAIPSAAGMTTGTNYDDMTELELWCSAPGTFNNVSGGVGRQSGTITLWGVQLEIGSVATPLEKPDLQKQLADCQRFFVVTQAFHYGYSIAGGQIGTTVPLPVPMRGAPTVAGGTSWSTNIGAITWGTLQGSNAVFAVAAVTVAGTGVLNCLVSVSAEV